MDSEYSDYTVQMYRLIGALDAHVRMYVFTLCCLNVSDKMSLVTTISFVFCYFVELNAKHIKMPFKEM